MSATSSAIGNPRSAISANAGPCCHTSSPPLIRNQATVTPEDDGVRGLQDRASVNSGVPAVTNMIGIYGLAPPPPISLHQAFLCTFLV
jgi:hypothetical protein